MNNLNPGIAQLSDPSGLSIEEFFNNYKPELNRPEEVPPTSESEWLRTTLEDAIGEFTQMADAALKQAGRTSNFVKANEYQSDAQYFQHLADRYQKVIDFIELKLEFNPF